MLHVRVNELNREIEKIFMKNYSQFVAKQVNTLLKYIYAHIKNFNSV